jgi:hypothetical protein
MHEVLWLLPLPLRVVVADDVIAAWVSTGKGEEECMDSTIMRTAADISGVVAGIAWPVSVIIIALILRKHLGCFFENVHRLKIGDVEFELKKLHEKMEAVESATRNLSVDIYKVQGDALRVREEIWQYIAEILDSDSVSDETRFQMRKALTIRHLPRLGVTAGKLRAMLHELDWIGPDTSGNEDPGQIAPDLIQAVYDFQAGMSMAYADGVVGPKTLALLRQELTKKGKKETAS